MSNSTNCGIYLIKNLKNNKEYIGQTWDLVDRKKKWSKQLKNKSGRYNQHLENSFAKYGAENFEFSIIDDDCDDQFDLNTTEIYYIWERDSYNPEYGYNKTHGGEGGKATEETILKLSGKNNHNYGKPVWNTGIKRPEITGENNWINKLTPEERQEECRIRSERMTGEGNSMFGVEPWNKDKKRPEMSGENHPNTDFTNDNVRDIKRKILTMTYRGAIKDIAAEYDVHPRVISKIKNGHSWKHVKIDEDDD
jgi:group I intron endonuclease